MNSLNSTVNEPKAAQNLRECLKVWQLLDWPNKVRQQDDPDRRTILSKVSLLGSVVQDWSVREEWSQALKALLMLGRLKLGVSPKKVGVVLYGPDDDLRVALTKVEIKDESGKAKSKTKGKSKASGEG